MITLALTKTLHAPQGALHLDIRMEIESGSMVTLYGKSGAGKTSVLRMLAGLMNPEQGLISVEGTTWLDTDNDINFPPQKRGIGMVFQDLALFPNMSVEDNLRYALVNKKDDEVITELVTMMELGDLRFRKPATLSGGQKQRVAVARSLVRKPKILLLDEPLAAVDRELRTKLQKYILNAHDTFETTTILVSHDIPEIFRMTDKVFEIEDGRIVRSDSPHSIFSSKSVSGKFQFVGEIIGIAREDVIHVVSVLIGNDEVKVVADANEVQTLHVGDRVLVASKAFNPIIKKI